MKANGDCDLLSKWRGSELESYKFELM